MLDTVAITLKDGYKITDYSRFTPNAKSLFEPPYRPWNEEFVVCSKQNPSKEDDTYTPKLTLSKLRGPGSYPQLRVEFSAPKLLYGNNLQEVEDKDFESVIWQLNEVLKEMAVETTTEALANASVSAMHYSKNIILEGRRTCMQILGEVHKSNLNGKLDYEWRSFKNGGEAVRFHCNSHELIFYNKVKDMEKGNLSPKRSIGGGGTIAEGSPFYNKEILRIEARLNKPGILRKKLERSGCKVEEEMKFKDLFSADTSKAVLSHFWSIIKGNMPLRVSERNSAADIFFAAAGLKIFFRLQLTAFILIVNELGISPIKELLGAKEDPRKFNELSNAVGAIKEKLKYSPFDNVDKALNAFITLK